MKRKIKQTSSKQLVFRIWVWLIAGFTLSLLTRLVYLQIFQTNNFKLRAEQNRVWKVVARAPRGRIFDRYGLVLADNELQFTRIYEENLQRKEELIAQSDAISLMASAPATVRQNYQRVYPAGPVTAHLVGYVQSPQTGDDLVFGRSGLERLHNDTLAGRDGLQMYERNAFGEPTRLLAQQPAEKGKDLKLSLDLELSKIAFEALGNQRGTVIISEPKTGQVLTIISKPSYLPVAQSDEDIRAPWEEEIANGQVAASLAEAINHAHNPFLFRPISAIYPPGSIFKIVTALAGLEYGSFDRDTTVDDEGVLTVGDYSYENWYWRQYGGAEGVISIVRAIARSNDIFFYKAAEWTGPQRLADFARLMNLGQSTKSGLPGEQAGLVPDPIWKQQHFGETWFLGNTYHMGIGQGDVLVTPIQLQTIVSAVAARGRLCRPQLLLDNAPICQELSLQDESLAIVKEGMRQACQSGGTGFPFFDAEYEVMCKTGTAEFGEANEQGYRPTHGLFALAVTKQPRDSELSAVELQTDIVITVLVESDDHDLYKEGSQDAAPVARTIADWWWANR